MENRNTNKDNEFRVRAQKKAKEKTLFTVSAVFVLTALVATGVYLSNRAPEELSPQKNMSELQQDAQNIAYAPEIADEGELQIVDSGMVENPGITRGKNKTETKQNDSADIKNETIEAEDVTDTQEVLSGEVENMMLGFSGMNMLWPIANERDVLIPYSMEKAVYFETLDQYKYNPAMIIRANEGTPVRAVSAGKITNRFWDYETGWTYEMDLGGGFKAYYGQLDNLQKAADTYVVAGDVLGYVAKPTKYYTKEGTNLYFAMTKDGKPVYPEAYIGE